MKLKSKIIFRVVFMAWVFIWLLFLARGLVKGEAEDYRNLFGKSIEDKIAYVAGGEFYDFILFCKGVIPADSDYRLEAEYDDSMDYFRFAYYMYPSLRNLDDPEYIACYKARFYGSGYRRAASLDGDKYILRRKEQVRR